MRLLLPLFLFIASVAGSEKPNVILILVDDLGYSDLGSYGGEIQTPNIDSMAYNGLRMTQLYRFGPLLSDPRFIDDWLVPT